MKNAKVNSLKCFAATGQRESPHLQSAMDAVERNGYEIIPHPAYSPDLTPSDFFLFPNLKKDIRGLHFRSDEEVVTQLRCGSMERTLTFSVLG